MVVTEALAGFIAQRMKTLGDLSTYDVARRSGGRLTNGTVWNVVNLRVHEIKGRTITGLAKALEVPEQELVERSRPGPIHKDLAASRESELMNYFRELPEAQKDDLVVLARALHGAHCSRPADIKVMKKKTSKRPRAA